MSVGSNIDRRNAIVRGIDFLRVRFGRLRVSSVYESEAVGFTGASFYNLVVGFVTELPAAKVAGELRAIEERCGRLRTGAQWCSRTLDLDLLTYGQSVMHANGLVLPRPEILTAPFVLRPLAEIAAQALHPVTKRSFAAHWMDFDGEKDAIWPVPLRLDAEAPAAISHRALDR